jgi:hypothetical protein
MWPRALEFMLGLWLLMSPFIFQRSPGPAAVWVVDFSCALLLMALSSLSFWSRARRAHLLLLPVSAFLSAWGYFYGGHPAAPVHQNEIFVGLILLLLAIIPSEANQPPRSWREYYAQRARMKEH